ncbi:MAG: IclR family transcriptional regulator C-terminal domain-containing protein [Xanthobacteraceae bacterium]
MTGTNSANRILAILDVFTEDRLEWTPEELMAELGYSRPTVYRYLKSLKEAGLLTSTPDARFTLGPRVVELDFLLRKSDPLIVNGQSHLQRLVSRYPCSALIVRWYGTKLLCVASECSTPNPLSSYPRGRPMQLARGAISRAIMAFLPRRQLEAMIAKNLDDLSGIGLGSTVAEVLESMRMVRKAGVAIAHGEVTPGVVGIASPVLNAGNIPVGSLSVTIAGQEVDPARLDAIAADVIAAARSLSAAASSDPDGQQVRPPGKAFRMIPRAGSQARQES